MDDDRFRKYMDHYIRISSLFREMFGYDLYFIGGTLLGLVREGHLLKNDKDMDVAYFSRFSDAKDVSVELAHIATELIERGEDIDLIRHNLTIRPNYLWWRIDQRTRIDIMPCWEKKGVIYRPTFVGFEGASDIILPLKKVQFHGYEVCIPARAEEKLTGVYGPGWRTPDPAFRKQKSASAKDELTRLDIRQHVRNAILRSKRYQQLQDADQKTFRERNFEGS